MLDERQHLNYSSAWDARVREDCGIALPPDNLGQWERTSLPLTVSQPYRSVFRSFSGYFNDEASEIRDAELSQEASLLNRLAGYAR